jgi:signal transduction histidine kinase/DNA-binding NarL/FixJ family response regulator
LCTHAVRFAALDDPSAKFQHLRRTPHRARATRHMKLDSTGSRRDVGNAAPDASFIVGGGETGALIRSIDWSNTRLGPARQWPQSLRTAINICVSSRFPIAVYWGPEFVMLYNDDLLPMVGANKHPQAMGRPAFEVLPEIRSIIEPMLQRVINTGEAIWSEDLMLPLFRSDGQAESYFTFTYSPIRDESGAVGGVFCAVLETTDKIIEERRLRLLNSLAEVTEAKTPDAACAHAATLLSRAASDVPFALMYLIDEAASHLRLAGAANIEPGSLQAPRSIALGDASLWPFDTSGQSSVRQLEIDAGPAYARGAVILPIDRAAGGQPLGFIVAGLSPLLRSSTSYERFHNLLATSISRSVSNAAAYEAERQRAEALDKLDRAKTAFFSNVSHEFRTPLTLMLAPIQDMLSAPPGAAIDRAAVDLLQRNALRLLKLVNTLLAFTRIEAGRAEVSFEPVDLAALTTDLASNFRAAIERAGLSLAVDCPPLPEPAYVDRDMWEKIVLNLLSNALKFTFDGAITVRLGLQGDMVKLEVQDTGTGIAEHELPRLFERFHRIEGARSRSHEGSGIGLALIHELVQLHGGAVAVRSQLGVGTTFDLRIPRGMGHLPAERIGAARAALSGRQSTTSAGAEPFVREALRWGPQVALDPEQAPTRAYDTLGQPRDRVLFADDNADMREYVTRLLGERWNVETVGDGDEALAAIKRNPPDLVLCDVMMPGLDGFALVRTLRSDEAFRALPIILLSARAGEEEAAKGLSGGANDYIAKPFSARDLLVRVATNLAAAKAGEDSRARERAQRENLYRHFMQAPFPVSVFRGREHVIELANPPMLRAWGKTQDIVGTPLLNAIPELRDQPFIGYLDGVFQTGIAYEGRSERARLPTGPNGELQSIFYHFVYAPLRDRSGAVEGVLVSAFDVTDIVFAREASEQARREAEAAERAQSAVLEFQERFVAVLGHDLRNPIAAVNMAAGLLGQRAALAKDDATARVVARIASSTRRMSHMVEQIMELSRSRVAGGFEVKPAAMDLCAVLSGIVDESKTAHPAKAIELECSPLVGVWDRERLEQVFSNLIGNAIHHGSQASPITIETHLDADRVHVDVHNEGPAIPEALRSKLFDPFRRGERVSRETKTAGLGLGLYISRELVVAHGGDIAVHSDAERGTTFRVTLPLTSASPKAESR